MLTTRPLSALAPLTDPSGAVLSGVAVTFSLVDSSMRPTAVWDSTTGELVVGSLSVTTDMNGLFTINLWPTQRGNIPCQYLCKVNYPGIPPFVFPVSDLATPLSWVDAMAGGVPLTPQQLAFYDSVTAAAQASATAAAGSAANAASSAAASAGSAAGAAASATAAAGSATNAAASATAAAGSASTAQTQATSASTALASLQAALASFNSVYLGKKTADPATDNNGLPLIVGAEYFNTTTNILRVYTASGWADYDVAAQTDAANAALAAVNAASSAAAAASAQTSASASAAAAALSAAKCLVPSQSLKTDYTIQAIDMGSLIMCTGPMTVTFPPPSAAFASAVPVILANINLPAVTLSGLPLSLGIGFLEYGEVAAFLCDGVSWYRLGADPALRGDLLKGSTGTGTSAVLTSDAGSPTALNQVVLLPNCSFLLTGHVIARCAGSSTQNQVAAAFEFVAVGYIGSTPGSIVIDLVSVTNLTSTTGWAVSITADTANGVIQIAFSGIAATNVLASTSTRMRT